MRVVNPVLPREVSWPWFIALAVRLRRRDGGRGRAGQDVCRRSLAGLVGGLVGGAAHGRSRPSSGRLATGHGVWYPVNLLAGMVLPGMGNLEAAELGQFHADWFLAAARHARRPVGGLRASCSRLVLPRLPPIPGAVAWGGLLLPLLWTGISYGLMGVVNPVLQERVDWPWFIVSQFVFGVAAAMVVLRSEMIHIPPAGRGPDRVADFVTGERGRSVVKQTSATGRWLPAGSCWSLLAAGCDLPGKPNAPTGRCRRTRSSISTPSTATHCAGCHGADGKLGPAPPLNDPLFLAIVPDAELRARHRRGRAVTPAQKTPDAGLRPRTRAAR